MLAAGKAFGDGSSSISFCLVLKQFDLSNSNTNCVSKDFLTFGVILYFVSVCFDVVLADLPGPGSTTPEDIINIIISHLSSQLVVSHVRHG